MARLSFGGRGSQSGVVPANVRFSTYTSTLDPGLLDRPAAPLTECSHRSVGRPRSERAKEGNGIRITWPWAENGRIKTVITRSGRRRRYSVPCFRGGDRDAHCEAPEEAHAAVLLDACCGIEFQEQPAKIEFDWYNGMTSHYPDFLVVSSNIKEFWECKKDHEAKDLLIRRRTERLQELLSPLGYRYRLVTTRHCEKGWYYRNSVAMRRSAKAVHDHPEWLKNLPPIPRQQPASAYEALSFVPEAERMLALYSLLYNGCLRAPLEAAVTPTVPVFSVNPDKETAPWVWELFEKSN